MSQPGNNKTISIHQMQACIAQTYSWSWKGYVLSLGNICRHARLCEVVCQHLPSVWAPLLSCWLWPGDREVRWDKACIVTLKRGKEFPESQPSAPAALGWLLYQTEKFIQLLLFMNSLSCWPREPGFTIKLTERHWSEGNFEMGFDCIFQAYELPL